MVYPELTVAPGALLLSAYLYFLGGGAALAAFFTAALAHELGHLIAMHFSGASVNRVRFTAAGAVIDYAGALTPAQEAGIVAAGPVTGILFSVGCFLADTPYFRYAGLVALLSSAFNLLPAYPMDGGRLARLYLYACAPEDFALRAARVIGCICASGVMLLGGMQRAPALIAMGAVMLANNVKMR